MGEGPASRGGREAFSTPISKQRQNSAASQTMSFLRSFEGQNQTQNIKHYCYYYSIHHTPASKRRGLWAVVANTSMQ
jgi:hypothetical protein